MECSGLGEKMVRPSEQKAASNGSAANALRTKDGSFGLPSDLEVQVETTVVPLIRAGFACALAGPASLSRCYLPRTSLRSVFRL